MPATKTYKYYDLILGAYVCVLLCANLIGPSKVTTVHVPIHEFGSAAARLLLDQISNGHGAPKRVIYTPELVVRGSTTLGADTPEALPLARATGE